MVSLKVIDRISNYLNYNIKDVVEHRHKQGTQSGK